MKKVNPTVSSSQIPMAFRAHRPKIVQFLGRLLLKLLNTSVIAEINVSNIGNKEVVKNFKL